MAFSVCRIIAIMALAVGITSGSVHGQTTEDRGGALTLLQESQRAYDAGEYEDALVLLRRAYGLYPAPGILYNIARTFEQLQRPAEAIEHYERYLEALPGAEDGSEVRRRIEELRQQEVWEVGETGSGQHPSERHPSEQNPLEQDRRSIESGAITSEQTPASSPEVGPSMLGPSLVVAAGTAVILGGIFPGMMAKDRDQSARNEALSHAEATSRRAQAEDHARRANLLYGVGAAVAAGGLAWLLVRVLKGEESDENTSALQWYPGGVAGRF